MIGSEAEFDEGAGVGSELGLPTLVCLELEHGCLGVGVPFGGGFAGQIVLADQSGLDGGHTFGSDGLLAVHFMGDRGRRGVVLDVRMSTGRGTVDAGGESRGCRKACSENESERGAIHHAILYLCLSLSGFLEISLWHGTKIDKKK